MSKVVFVENKQARCAVQLSHKATSTEIIAANELKKYFYLISGAEIEICKDQNNTSALQILMGEAARNQALNRGKSIDDIEDDGFLLELMPDNVLLTGKNDRGTLYAVYELLEYIGVRWYLPGDENEYIPKLNDIMLPSGQKVVNPSFKLRLLRAIFAGMLGINAHKSGQTWQYFASPNREALLDWGVKNRINTLFTLDSEPFITDYFAARGGHTGIDQAHAVASLVNSDEYFESHPDYFAMNKAGKRFKRFDAPHSHLCYSNPDVIDLISHKVIAKIAKNPGIKFVNITQADGIHYCNCSVCLAKNGPGFYNRFGKRYPSRTNLIIDYANKIAERVVKFWPEHYVVILAYHSSMNAPSIPVHPNVWIQVVHSRPQWCVWNRHLADNDTENHRLLCETVDQWKVTDRGLIFYDYNPHSSFAQVPYPAATKFNDDIKWLHNNGFIGYHSQSECSLWGIYGWNHVVIARTLWNTKLDFNALQEDFFNTVYGKAGPPIQAMYKILENALMTYEPMITGLGVYLSSDTFAKVKVLMMEAKEMERSNNIHKHIEILRKQIDYAEMVMDAKTVAIQYENHKKTKDLAILKRKHKTILKKIKEHPMDQAYHFAGIYHGLDLYLVGNKELFSNIIWEDDG